MQGSAPQTVPGFVVSAFVLGLGGMHNEVVS